ncbi:MAG: hypothetical protein GF353_28860 [Candidatus Lokiarchaeota archaeon]|nr:hypothetical protein [Candidatus Lokiarchaeota archaeon]
MKTKNILIKILILLIITLNNSCDLENPSEPENEGKLPPIIESAYKSKTTIKVGELINLSVTASDPQGLDLYYMWTFGAVDGENFVNGNFVSSEELKNVTWQAKEIWSNVPDKNYGVIKFRCDVYNMYNTATTYIQLTVYP